LSLPFTFVRSEFDAPGVPGSHLKNDSKTIQPPMNAHPSSLPLLPKEKGKLEPPLSIPHPFPFSREEKGKLEPPLSAGERGGGEGRTRIASGATL
jgi:hypothetical protein